MIRNCVSLFILLITICTWGQNNLVFSPINTSNGLSDNRIRAINQMPDGRMLIVTEGLVNIYDGTGFRYLHFNDREAYLIGNYPRYCRTFIDSENLMWMKDHYKLFCFDLNKEIFIPHIDSIFSSYSLGEQIDDIFIDSEKNFWYLTVKDELYFRDKKENKIRLFISNVSTINGNKDQLFEVLVQDRLVYFFYRSGQIICYQFDTAEQIYTEDYFKKTENKYTNTLLVVPYKQYLYQVRNGYYIGGLLVRFNINTRKWEKILETNNYWLNTLTIDRNGDCKVSSIKGIWEIDESLLNIQLISKIYLVDGSVFKTEINTQYIDNKDGLWVGTLDRGLLYYHKDRFKFRNYGRTYFNLSNIEQLRITCFAELNREILIGTNSGLFKYNRNSQTLIRISEIPENTLCNKLLKDSRNRIFLCTQNKGIYVIENNSFKRYQYHFFCQNLFESSDGNYYLSTNDGFGVFDPNTGNYKKILSSVKLGYIYQLMDFGKDTLLGVSYGDGGLFVYDIKNNRYTFPEDEKNWMLRHSNKKCHDMFTDHRGLIWFATQDGLNVYNPHDRTLRSFFDADGLINNNIRSVVEDSFGRIWVSTSYGISCIYVSNKNNAYHYSFANYNHFDGVLKNEFIPRSVFLTNDNCLIWGGIDGFNEINLNRSDSSNQLISKPLFTRFLLFGNEIKAGKEYDGKIILNQSITSTKNIELKHYQNFISFEFSSLNYTNPTQTYYRYKLNDIDNSWHIIGTPDGLGRVSYTNLSPGTYHLKVFATTNKQLWNDQFSEISFTIQPPYWKTPLAYIIYIILFFGTLTFCIYIYLKWNKKKMFKNQKEEMDQMKLSFFTNISHELRTPLTLIITPLESILKKYKTHELSRKLSGIYWNAKDLLKLVNQLLDFRKLEMKAETVYLSYCSVDECIEMIVQSFKDLAIEKGIEFKFELQTKNLFANIDMDKLHKIVNNLLSNAIKFTPKGGQVALRLNKHTSGIQNESKIILEVSDTGCGIPEHELSLIFDHFYRGKQVGTASGSGIGLYLVKKYVELHQGTVKVKSNVNEGSTFTIEIPDNLAVVNNFTSRKSLKDSKPSAKILIVDDNVEFQTFLLNELAENYQVFTASDGEQGLQKAKEMQPDLVITDIMMPKMSGTELCHKLKNDIQISHIPVILLTAKSSEQNQVEGFRAGADAFVAKPFNMDILLIRIQNLIKQQEQRKKMFRKEVEISPGSLTLTDIDEQLINTALKHIEQNLDNTAYSVEQLSKDMFMDRTGLYRKLLAIVGQTPTEFIRSVRLKKAAQLLKKGIPVNEVAVNVGFGTISYFSKCFYKEFGMKPSSYKNPEK